MKDEQIDIVVPSDGYGHDGKMKWLVLNDSLYAGYVDICSRSLTAGIFHTYYFQKQEKTPIKINYCFHGRCEVMLGSGSITYVTGNEIAVDYGTSKNEKEAFFYPSSEYEGIEIIMYLSAELEKEMSVFGGINTIKAITEKFEERSVPFITTSNQRIKRCAEDIKEDIINFTDSNLLRADIVKLLLVLKGFFYEPEKRRTFCTRSQADIARKAFEMITADLSKRYSAAELASVFGVSESSLKNYFRAVFGRGYKELVCELRMKKAAELIVDSKKSMGEIAESVGYQNQSRFLNIIMYFPWNTEEDNTLLKRLKILF